MDRHFAADPNTPEYVTRLALGVGTKAATFSTSFISDNTTWEVPSDQGVFKARAKSPSP